MKTPIFFPAAFATRASTLAARMKPPMLRATRT
jgi:hypothetical protein